MPSRDVHAGQRGEQEDLHGSPDVSLHRQPVQHLLVLQGKTYIFDHKSFLLLKVRLYLRGICPNQQMSSLGKLIIIPWPYGFDKKYNIVMSSHLMSTPFEQEIYEKILKLHSNLHHLRKVPKKLDHSEGELSVHHVLVPLRLCHPVPHHLQHEHTEPFTSRHLLDLQWCLFHLHTSLPWPCGPMAKGGTKALLWCKMI